MQLIGGGSREGKWRGWVGGWNNNGFMQAKTGYKPTRRRFQWSCRLQESKTKNRGRDWIGQDGHVAIVEHKHQNNNKTAHQSAVISTNNKSKIYQKKNFR